MKGSVIFAKPPLAASEANATSSTTTRPLSSRARGSLRGDAKASSGRDDTRGVLSTPVRDDTLLAMTAALPLELDDQGLLPVVVQDHLTGEVRMVAFANAEA